MNWNWGGVGELVVEVLYPPMGGRLSEVVCSLVAAHYEITTSENLHWAKAERFIPNHASDLQTWLGRTGFVDDINTMSRILGPACQHAAQQHFLPAEAGYGLKSDSANYKYLNSVLHFRPEGLVVLPP